MFLKSIEIQGFKSFAHKTVLNFNEGMTAIVGPNGSGKSNIADAVRWVLGEQKVRQLRGSSMQDVIFAGTELRKPLGFAFVSMTFDNADRALPLDYAEVTVSRRLYRSGESEYMLNGQNVRLRDVQELFFDTGIGKEGYSIIGQGQIEAIVSGRPEDRRGLFDEACGIVKFKKRKQAAEKKLEEEEVNLNRITDLLRELERRVGPLEKQSAGAREYLKLRDILKKYELTVFVQETDRLLNDLTENESASRITAEALEEARRENEQLKAANQELTEQLRLTEESIAARKEEKLKGELLITNLESQISVAESGIASEKAGISLLKETLGQAGENGETRIGAARAALQSLQQIRHDFELLQERQDLPSDDPDLTAAGTALNALETEEGHLKTLCPASAEAEVFQEPGPQNGEAADSDEEDFEFAEPEWLRAIHHKRDGLTELREKEEELASWLDTASSEYNRLTFRLKQCGEAKNAAVAASAMASSKLQAMKNIAERYEGYGQAVQQVMQLKNSRKGILGVVADLIRTKPEYETAIETALGSRIQNVVTDSEQTAKAAIEYLKKNRFGRVTFLPLDALRSKIQEEYRKACSEPGCLGLASELVDTDPEYETLAMNLLGGTLVFPHIDQALAVAAKYRHSLRIVTLEGELLSPGGAISGGAFRNSSNLLGRTRELELLREKAAELAAGVRDAADKTAACEREIAEKNSEIAGLEQQLGNIRQKISSLMIGMQSDLKLKISSLRQSAEYLLSTVQRIAEEESRAAAEKERLLSRLTASETAIENYTASIAARKEDILHVRSGLEESLKKAEEAERKKTELTVSQSRYFEKKDEISDEILRLEKESIRLENIREKLNSRLDENSGHIWEEYELTINDARKEADSTLGSLSEMKEKTAELNGKIRALGVINIQAIEEYKEVSERYELMKTQHADITAAREQILGIIKELDEGMKARFNEQFSEIRKEFASVFQELFGGGQADLELSYDGEEEQDELSAGISISAQPPGKKLQNMMQLSGGEKAFTAIALLFAIQNLKPSPFCLLDEIEAALDDSNVLRFAQYIRRICSRSQFILITHRRGTMESADRLYGITMQEKGVTSLVSVDLVSDSLS